MFFCQLLALFPHMHIFNYIQQNSQSESSKFFDFKGLRGGNENEYSENYTFGSDLGNALRW